MQHSETIAALSAALATAQGQIEGAKKDSANPHFKSKYADLASCWDACREALSKNGLAIIQAPGEAADGVVEMTTMLVHKSGEYISERLTIPLAKVDAQGYGSAITYARRYALTAMVGIAPEDDDGNAATAHGPANNSRPKQAPQQAPQKAVVPPNGWEEWGRDIIVQLDSARDEAKVDDIKARHLDYIKAARTAAAGIYTQVGEAITKARSELAKEAA